MQCSCGRGEASPYGYRALGQWIEACDHCASEYADSRRRGIFHGESYRFVERHQSSAHATCAWCATRTEVIADLHAGRNGWPICRRCYTEGAGEEPWLFRERVPELRRSRDALLHVYESVFGRRPAPLPTFAESDPRGPLGSGFPLTLGADDPCFTATYMPSESPSWVRTRERSVNPATEIGAVMRRINEGSPGYHVWFFAVPHVSTPRALWKVDHRGGVFTEDEPSPQARAAWDAWVESVGDPLLALARADAEALLAQLDAADAPRPSRIDVWRLKLTAARLAAASFPDGLREEALDALCGLGWYGDTRPELVPSPDQMATARWPLHPVVPLSAELQRRPRDQ